MKSFYFSKKGFSTFDRNDIYDILIMISIRVLVLANHSHAFYSDSSLYRLQDLNSILNDFFFYLFSLLHLTNCSNQFEP